MASRDPKKLVPELYELYLLFDKEMKEAKIDYILTCTTRTQVDQDALWTKGRTTPGAIVTWTLKSKHIEGKAFDIAILKDGKITWATNDYKPAVEIGRRVGLDCGGDWFKTKDWPHFQLKEKV
jgi:peptidoglycan L-alanyl-D-glutamate endopeptidase CwlK